MCELFGVTSGRKIQLNELLSELFSHGIEHPNGWGMAFFYDNAVSLEKQPEASHKSDYLKQRLQFKVEADKMIAHIRLATRGNINYENTHPFVMRDRSNRTWTLAHNGTIFECDLMNYFTKVQQGQTDSERILAYIVSRINLELEKKKELSMQERFELIDETICEITPENKVNLILFDGELMYVHTNYKNSLYRCKKGEAVVISTRPLDSDKWENVPINTLIAYQDGKQVYTGTNHNNEFFDSEEKMRLLFLDFANL
ncbi:MAG: class II glutamine amidotransferase [Lachnospiraceae bacterium]|nr:class II glutamine amidotransferase [Lachnospiraceae bacterium]MDE6698125.1 class II glutamine amidotransferase [Lachnospiraceae bacterium]